MHPASGDGRFLHGAGQSVGLRFMSPYQAAVSALGTSRAGCPLKGWAVNSDERRAARRARREQARAAKREERVRDCTLENVAALSHLVDAANKSANGIRWKSSVIRYHLDTLGNAQAMRSKLLAGEDIHTGYVNFTVFERGKLRQISAVKFPERVAQKAMNQYALMPSVKDSLIYDNSANVKGKGTSFAVARLKKHLADHHRKHGREGYILLGDFSGFFPSIPHAGACELVRRYLDDEGVVELICSQINTQEGSLGLTLGSEVNQTIAVAYPSRIDHFVVECGGVEAYGRYMDDFYAISTDKERLKLLLGCIDALASSLGLALNAKKTHIVKLTHGFTYLKRKFSYEEGGRVVVRPLRDTVTRQRRKLKKLARLVGEGRVTYEQACRSYQSWRGHILKMDAHGLVLRMDALFAELFGDRRSKITEDPPSHIYNVADHTVSETPRNPRGFLLPENLTKGERDG